MPMNDLEHPRLSDTILDECNCCLQAPSFQKGALLLPGVNQHSPAQSEINREPGVLSFSSHDYYLDSLRIIKGLDPMALLSGF